MIKLSISLYGIHRLTTQSRMSKATVLWFWGTLVFTNHQDTANHQNLPLQTPHMSFCPHLHPFVLLDHLLRTPLPSGIPSVVNYFNNWYLVIFAVFLFNFSMKWEWHLQSSFPQNSTGSMPFMIELNISQCSSAIQPSCNTESNYYYLKLGLKLLRGVEYKT